MDFKRLLADTVILQYVDSEEVEAQMTRPKDPSMGDWCLPCFKFAGRFGKSPAELAKDIVSRIGGYNFLEKAEAVGPYVNFTLDKKTVAADVIERVLGEGDAYGGGEKGAGKTICIDYSSVNIAKPFHMGHMLNTSIGAALCRIYRALGYNVVGINHLGDWGTQFGKLIVAFKKWGDREEIEQKGVRGLLDIYVKFHTEAEKCPELEDEARAWFKKIEDGDNEALGLFKWFKDITMKEVGRVYDRLGVTFDSYAGESFYNDKMQPVLDELKAKGLLEESDGAQVVRFPKDKYPPCLLVRSDGATLYATRDLAAAVYRKKTYDFAKCLYVVAYQQDLHFKQLFEVLRMMGKPWADDMVHVAHGMVSLEDGALSTRSGHVVFLEDVLNTAVSKALETIEAKSPDLADKEATAEAVGVGAVTFAMLYNGRIKDITFSYDKVLNFDGETGPYVQYTYARCASLMQKVAREGDEEDLSGIADEEGRALVTALGDFPEAVEQAAEKYEPSVVARQVMAVAQAFNKFYLGHNIAGAEPAVKNARLSLVAATMTVLRNGLKLLGAKTPERM